ncbi:lantibiotic dehydratase [Kitasatospora sp. MAP12-44]|uniref:lantibiotic dehydratase n=1 Tax=unclassified Kitasatospora TaxID=2633591 RepID=UPI002476EC1D|nr:lantibiotic dehydratase [Kitasatospora sp. MAP12-44]MDH6107949.1 thiopeptide-type bacteriocin biosynthesis protein [Kitasatospora sp. MAP12-44]
MRSRLVPDPVALARLPLLAADSPKAGGLITEGLFLASRDLDGAAGGALARAAYELRARTRTTPNGVWAAAATAHLVPGEPVLLLGEQHRCATLPNPAWLAAVADRALELADGLDHLRLFANPTALQRGAVLEVEHPGPDGSAQLGTARVTEVSSWLMRECSRAGGAPASRVIRAMLKHWPGADTAAVQAAITSLVRTGLLLTDLLPADLSRDPLGHLATRLPPTAGLREAVLDLRALLAGADRHRPGTPERLPLLRAARCAADAIHATARPLTCDTIGEAELRLPTTVGRETARTVNVLWRIGHRTAPLLAWTARFRDVYGPHRLVPLLDAVDPATGIGPPGPEDAIGARSDLDDRRAHLLLALLTTAIAHGDHEVELTEEMVDALAHDSDARPPRTAEAHVRVREDKGGHLTLVIGTHAAQDAGSAAGRLARYLPDLSPEQQAGADPVLAEIVCRPLTASTGALAVESGGTAYRIPVGLPLTDSRDLDPRTLLITTTAAGHLALYSRQLGCLVRPVLLSRITRALLPPAAQLLHLIGHADERPWHPWSWGPAALAPYTPRVTYRSTVLAPQRWLLPPGLAALVEHRDRWHAHLDDWLARPTLPIPQQVVIEESDRHLPIDLRDADHRELLRRSVRRGCRTVSEVLPGQPPVHGPDGRHHLELVVTLRQQHQAARSVPLDPRAAARPRNTDAYLPGSAWLSLALPVPVRHQDAVLAQLPEHPGSLFYWLRYTTPDLGPHLRLRYHGAPEMLASVQQEAADLAERLAEQHLTNGRLTVAPYERETQRYGGPDAIGAAEAVFAADSALVLAALPAHGDDQRLILAAHTAAAIARTLSTPTAARPRPLPAGLRRHREALRVGCRTATIPGALTGPWKSLMDALTAYRPLVADEVARLCASDVIHMHCNRLLGTDRIHEHLARSLAADLLRHA